QGRGRVCVLDQLLDGFLVGQDLILAGDGLSVKTNALTARKCDHHQTSGQSQKPETPGAPPVGSHLGAAFVRQGLRNRVRQFLSAKISAQNLSIPIDQNGGGYAANSILD